MLGSAEQHIAHSSIRKLVVLNHTQEIGETGYTLLEQPTSAQCRACEFWQDFIIHRRAVFAGNSRADIIHLVEVNVP